MKPISIGKFRGLQQCSSGRGTFTCLALDHRQNLRKANPAFVDNNELSSFKLDVTAELAACATAVLLDPEVSAAQAITAGKMPGDKGLVVAMESTGYTGDPTARRGQIIPGWSVEKARRMGASMVKLLVYYHSRSETAPAMRELVAQVSSDCQRLDVAPVVSLLNLCRHKAWKSASTLAVRFLIVESPRPSRLRSCTA